MKSFNVFFSHRLLEGEIIPPAPDVRSANAALQKAPLGRIHVCALACISRVFKHVYKRLLLKIEERGCESEPGFGWKTEICHDMRVALTDGARRFWSDDPG